MAMLPRSLLWLFLCCFSSSVVSPSVSLSVSPVMFSAAFSGRISGYPSPCLTQLADTFIGTTKSIFIYLRWVRRGGEMSMDRGAGHLKSIGR